MNFQPKDIKKKSKHINKSLYISEELVAEIDRIAAENDTSFNNVVISMIESCLKKD